MINIIIMCLLIMSLLLLVLAFLRNSSTNITRKVIASLAVTAALVFGIISNAQSIGSEINDTKNIISNTANDVYKLGTDKAESLFNAASGLIFNTAESVQSKSIETMRSIITGDKKVAVENKEEDIEAAKVANEQVITESEVQGKTEDEALAVITDNLTPEEYSTEKLMRTGLTKDESVEMIKKLNEIGIDDMSNISVNFIGN